MTGPTWETVKEVCLSALELPVTERAAYLDQACGADRGLRREVESLLGQYDPDFLEDPLLTLGSLQPAGDHGPPRHPATIGSYRIVRPVGRGGMGEVLLAIQEGEGFERAVAIKLIRSGMATEDVLSRFRLERRILASLEHPNLARLIDGGATDEGLPYFVMEYVDGLPITEYCDRKSLTVSERLNLFMSVCEAVHHAHQSLVVHRDIKPSNILVTPDGSAKLLDFGIGKVLDPTESDSGDRTAMTQRVLTPEYAAPEQVRGGVITTATDVHGLGVLLYELLTGQHPFSARATTPEQLDRALLEATPTPPSTVVTLDRAAEAPGGVPSPSDIARMRGTVPARLRRRLRGDLDNIVLRALRKEPERRYASAEAMRADVARHLDGLPVLARPDSPGYRASKFVTRNPWGVTAACLALVAISVSIILPWQQNRRLTEERDKALEVRAFLLEAFGTTGGDESIGARDLLDLQASRVDSVYGDRADVRAQMHLALGEAYDRLGLYNEARTSAESALTVLRGLHDGDHPDVATALNAMGWALHRVGAGQDGVGFLVEAVDMRRRFGRRARRELARSLNDLGVVRERLGESEAAAALHREALAIRRTVLGDTDRTTGVSASNLAAALYQMGDLEGAVREAQLALELLSRSVGPDHQRTTIVQNNLATFMYVSGDIEGAAAQYRDLLERQSRLQGRDHPVTNQVRTNLANMLSRLERREEAERLLREAIEYAKAAGDAGLDRELTAIALLSDVLGDQGRDREVLALLDEAIPRTERDRPGSSRLATFHGYRGDARSRLGDVPGAAADQRRHVELREAVSPPDAEPLARSRLHLAGFLVRAGELAAADSVLGRVRASAAAADFSVETLAWLSRIDTLDGGQGR